MIVITALVGAIGLLLLLPTISDVTSLAWAALHVRSRRAAVPPAVGQPNLLFLVPAHDEELLVTSCVQSLTAQEYPAQHFSVTVVADNCTDRTAQLARTAGACCLERSEPLLRGKPRAIAWALAHLTLRNYDAVVIVDADTVVDPGFAAALAQAAPLNDKAGQAYLGVRNRCETMLTRMATVCSEGLYRLAYSLKQAARLNVPLIGNGMWVGTTVLARHGWTAFSICEDWELYASLTARGVCTARVPNARLYAQEASSLHESTTQRLRWTGGRWTVLARYTWPLLQSPRISVRQKVDAIAELAAAGPASHLGVVLVLTGLIWIVQPPGSVALMATLAGSLVRPLLYAIGGLVADPDPVQALAAFAYLPIYTVWRIAVTVQSLKMLGEKPWIRTERRGAVTRPIV